MKILNIILTSVWAVVFPAAIVYTLAAIPEERNVALVGALFYVGFLCLFIVMKKKDKSYRDLLSLISCEHVLVTRNVAVFQTGYVRIRIERLAAGIFSFKEHLRIIVNFPCAGSKEVIDRIQEDVKEIVGSLQAEGFLIANYMHIKSEDNSGDVFDGLQVLPYSIILDSKGLTPQKLADVYDSLMKVIEDNDCQYVEQFTIQGTSRGTVYRHYRGNMCAGMIESEFNSRKVFLASFDRPPYFRSGENDYAEKDYVALRDSLRSHHPDITIKEACGHISQIFAKPAKGMNFSVNSFKPDSLIITVNVVKGNIRRNHKLMMERQNGLWWIYGYGNMMDIPILTTERQAEALHMLMRLCVNMTNYRI